MKNNFFRENMLLFLGSILIPLSCIFSASASAVYTVRHFLSHANQVNNVAGDTIGDTIGDTANESQLLSRITEEFMKIDSSGDRRLICVLFSGSAQYIKNCKTLESTRQFDPILGEVQSSYGWDRERYPSFTDAVSDYLVFAGYDEPVELNNEKNKENFYKIFSRLAEATRYEK